MCLSNQIVPIILAGGKSERMKRSTGLSTPKAMMPFDNQNLLSWQIGAINCRPTNPGLVSVSHDADQIEIEPYFLDRGWSIEKIANSRGSGETLAKTIDQRMLQGKPVLSQQVDTITEKQRSLYFDLLWAFNKIEGKGSIIVVDPGIEAKGNTLISTHGYGTNQVFMVSQPKDISTRRNHAIDCGIHLFSAKATQVIPEIVASEGYTELYQILNALVYEEPIYAFSLWPQEWVNINTKEDLERAECIISW